jgi:ribose-phosphate pyrophosphokinase
MDRICLVSGSSNIELANSIANYLGIPLASLPITRYGNTEFGAKCDDSVKEKIVFVIQTGAAKSGYSVNDALIELLTICNAVNNHHPSKLVIIMPNFPYARSDKKEISSSCINAKMVCQLLETQKINRIISMDLHSGQIGGFTNRTFDNLYGIDLFIDYLKQEYLTSDDACGNYILVSPDAGSIRRVTSYAERLSLAHIIMHKQRDYTKVSKVVNSVIIGDVSGLEGKTGILIDDIVDTAGTMDSVVRELSAHGMTNFVIVATHGIFSSPALDRINDNSMISRVIVTNTIPQADNIALCDKIVSLDVGKLFGENIRQMVVNGSAANAE